MNSYCMASKKTKKWAQHEEENNLHKPIMIIATSILNKPPIKLETAAKWEKFSSQ